MHTVWGLVRRHLRPHVALASTVWLAFAACVVAKGQSEPTPDSSEARVSLLPSAPSALRSLPQQPVVASPAPSGAGEEPVSLTGLPERVWRDQIAEVKSPAHLRVTDMRWLLPLAGATAAAFANDTHTERDVLTQDPNIISSVNRTSDGLRNTFLALPVGLFALGEVVHNDHARETGLLGGEAILDAGIVGYLVKFATFRENPTFDNARGAFYQKAAGYNSSFPSGHAIVAWSSAAVLADEYRSPWAQVGVYTMATGVSLTRVVGHDHFPSDALVGSAAGWLIGHYVYREHHRKTR